MEPLQQAVLVLVTAGAGISLAGLAFAVYELRTGRLLFARFPFRRRFPLTPKEAHKNGMAMILNGMAALLLDVLVLSELLLERVRLDPLLAVCYAIVGLAAFTAVILLTLTSLHLRGLVRFGPCQRSASLTTARD